MKTSIFTLIFMLSTIPCSAVLAASDVYDLDDIRHWELVSVETCLDAAIDTIPGHPRKLEMKLEEDDPVYEFDIEANDNRMYNVECDAEKGVVIEIEKEVAENDRVFKQFAKVSQKDAEAFALAIHPGKIVAREYEIGFDGSFTYEFDIQSKLGYEVKVDVDAITGKIEEVGIELYEIGMEDE